MQKDEIISTLKPKRKLWKILSSLCVITALCGGGAYYYLQPKEVKITYETITPKRGDIATIISATGTLNPLNEVQIGSQVSGIISQIDVDTNDVVSKGQVLAKIDDKKILQELSRYRAHPKSAKVQLNSHTSTLSHK